MAWELIFMLLLLKIPLFYLCGVVWYAVRAEPGLDEAPEEFTAVREPYRPGSGARGGRRVGPPRRPTARRSSRARMEARR